MRQPLRATKDRAATLARLTQQARQELATRGERGQQPSVAVRIKTAVPSGNYAQHDGMLLSLVGGVLTETGQTVRVRHAGEGSIAAGTVVTPEPCGQLGLCYMQSAEIVREAVRLYRPARIVGPQAAAGSPVADYTASWGFGPWYHPPNFYSRSGYFADIDFSALPDGFNTGGSWYWIKKMQPMRYALHNYDGQFSPFLFNGESPHFGPRFTPLQVGSANVIGVTGHLSPYLVSGATIQYNGDCLGINIGDVRAGGSRPVETAAQPLPITGRYMSAQASQAYTRVWVDGVDVTGIIAGASRGYAGASIDPPAELIGNTLEVDVWWRLVVYLSSQGRTGETIPSNGTLQAVRQVLLLPSEEAIGILGAIDYGGPALEQAWTLAFDVNGPFAATSLVMGPVPTSGWAWQVYLTWTKMSRTSGGIEAIIEFDWRESDRPLIKYTRRNPSTPFAGDSVWYYRPADTADFKGLTTLSGYEVKKGMWNPDASTVFELFYGRSSSGTGYRYGGGVEPDELDFSAVPQQITASKVV